MKRIWSDTFHHFKKNFTLDTSYLLRVYFVLQLLHYIIIIYIERYC